MPLRRSTRADLTRRRARALAALLAVGLVAACSGSEGGGDRDAIGRTPTSAAGPPAPGGVLRVGVAGVASLDPARARGDGELLAADLLFDGLTKLDGDRRVVPGVADRWSPAADRRRWDFHLDPEARFADGTPVAPADAVASLLRARDLGSAGGAAGALDVVTGITSPAPDLVTIELARPIADLPLQLTHPALGVVPARLAADAGALDAAPVGSGPFVLASRTRSRVRLVRPPSDSRAGVTPGGPYLDGIDLVIEGAASAYRSFETGGLDVAPVPAGSLADAERRFGRRGIVPRLTVILYGFNLRNPGLQDPRIREAIIRAADRPAILAAGYGATAQPIDGPVARGVAGFQTNPCAARCAHDVARARDLVRDAAPGGVPNLPIDVPDDPGQRATAEQLSADLRAAGIPAPVRTHPVGEYAAFVGRGDAVIFRLDWAGAWPAADAFLAPLFRSGASTNVIGFDQPVVDAVLDEARATVDGPARAAAFRDAERRIMDFVPVLPLGQLRTRTVVSARVQGLAVNGFGTFDGATVWLA